ncbi:MAG: hypothetical protein ACLTDS_16095 [Bianqueaceae bacterium]
MQQGSLTGAILSRGQMEDLNAKISARFAEEELGRLEEEGRSTSTVKVACLTACWALGWPNWRDYAEIIDRHDESPFSAFSATILRTVLGH